LQNKIAEEIIILNKIETIFLKLEVCTNSSFEDAILSFRHPSPCTPNTWADRQSSNYHPISRPIGSTP
jgi:hypothetical protein